MVIITLSDIIGIILVVGFIAFLIIACIVSVIVDTYKEKSKKWHNCYECKNHYLKGVSSVGGYSYWKCQVTDEEVTEEPNQSYTQYRKCDKFESEEKKE